LCDASSAATFTISALTKLSMWFAPYAAVSLNPEKPSSGHHPRQQDDKTKDKTREQKVWQQDYEASPTGDLFEHFPLPRHQRRFIDLARQIMQRPSASVRVIGTPHSLQAIFGFFTVHPLRSFAVTCPRRLSVYRAAVRRLLAVNCTTMSARTVIKQEQARVKLRRVFLELLYEWGCRCIHRDFSFVYLQRISMRRIEAGEIGVDVLSFFSRANLIHQFALVLLGRPTTRTGSSGNRMACGTEIKS